MALCVTNTHILPLLATIIGGWLVGGSEAQLTSASAVAGKCLPISKAKFDLEWTSIFAIPPTSWYVPMGARYSYRKYAELFMGRPASDAAELERMGLRFSCSSFLDLPSHGVRLTSGFGTNFTQLCQKSKSALGREIPGYACTYTNEKAKNKEKPTTFEITIIWKDEAGEGVMLVKECINGNRGFSVWSRSPSLTPATRQILLQKIPEAGYSAANIAYMNYSADGSPPPPAPTTPTTTTRGTTTAPPTTLTTATRGTTAAPPATGTTTGRTITRTRTTASTTVRPAPAPLIPSTPAPYHWPDPMNGEGR